MHANLPIDGFGMAVDKPLAQGCILLPLNSQPVFHLVDHFPALVAAVVPQLEVRKADCLQEEVELAIIGRYSTTGSLSR